MRIAITIIIVTFILALFALMKLEKHEVQYVKSTIDGKDYLVRDLKDKQQAADILAELKKNIMTLTDHMHEHKNDLYKEEHDSITQLKNKIKNVIINESTEDSVYTSYSVNKGEQIVFCLRSKYTNQLHDINLIMYVALHEMGHVGCKSFGHTAEFKRIFAFFTRTAIKMGLYKKIDFNNDPSEYCGLLITDSVV